MCFDCGKVFALCGTARTPRAGLPPIEATRPSRSCNAQPALLGVATPIASRCRPSENMRSSVATVALTVTNTLLIGMPGMCAVPDASIDYQLDRWKGVGHCSASYGVGPTHGPDRTGGSDSTAAHNAVNHNSNTAAANKVMPGGRVCRSRGWSEQVLLRFGLSVLIKSHRFIGA